jgi:dsDNA-specific endonuclease/ATPase MutS2
MIKKNIIQNTKVHQKTIALSCFLIHKIISCLEIMAKLKLDLHDIYNKSWIIDKELEKIIQDAISKKICLVEIIPGKGSGQLKKKVLRFLNQPNIKKLYHRIEKDDKNFGRIFVHFKF